MTRTVIVWGTGTGTGSGAGQSFVATALCRAAARRGLDMAPFKAQNMSSRACAVACGDDAVAGLLMRRCWNPARECCSN